MHDECTEFRHKNLSSKFPDKINPDRAVNTSRSGKLPISLLRQAMTSPKILKTFQDFKDRNDLPFAEDSPSIELILEHELAVAYDEVLGKIEEEKATETNLMLTNAIEIETVCQDFIEEVLAEHLETQLDYLGDRWSELLQKKQDATAANGEMIGVDREPETAELPNAEALGPVTVNQQINGIGRDPSNLRKFARASLLGGMLVGPALAVAVFAKVQSPEKFDGFVDLALAKTGQFLVAMVPDEENAATGKDAISAGAIRTDIKKSDSPVTASRVENPVRNGTDNYSRTIPDAAAVSLAGAEPPSSAKEFPVVLEVPTVAINEKSIINSKIKAYQGEVAHLEKLLSNPNQEKREEIETLIRDKKAALARLGGSVTLAVESSSRQGDGVQPANFVVTEDPDLKQDVAAYQAEPSTTTTVGKQNVQQANLTNERPAGERKSGQPAQYYHGKFENIISIRQLPEQQRFALAEQLAKGECLVPAIKSALNPVPALVMRDLVLSLPEHC